MGLGAATTILFENDEGVFVPVSEDNPLPTSGGGGGGGAVDSVNGQTGVVVLDAGDIEVSTGVSVLDELTQQQVSIDAKADAGVTGLFPGTSLHVYWTGTEWPAAPTDRTDITIFWHGGSSAAPAPLREGIDVWIKAVE